MGLPLTSLGWAQPRYRPPGSAVTSSVFGSGTVDTAGSVEPAVVGPTGLPESADVLRVAESGFVSGRRLPGGREVTEERLLTPVPAGSMVAELLIPLGSELVWDESDAPEIDSELGADALMPDCKELISDKSELTSSEPVDEAEVADKEIPDSVELVAIGDELVSDTPDDTPPEGRAAALLLSLMLACRELSIDDSELISEGRAEKAEERLTPDSDAVEASEDELTSDTPDDALPVD